MKFLKPSCPKCRRPAIGTCETVPGVAEFEGDPTKGPVEYSGSTEVFWDGQKTVSRAKGTVVLQCAAGDTWNSKVED